VYGKKDQPVWIGTLNEIFLVKSSYRLEKERSIQEKKEKENA
jgi:hypothetical protein